MKKNTEFYPRNIKLIINQWYKNGDHPEDRTVNRLNDGKVVARLKATKSLVSLKPCPLCKHLSKDHGLLVKPLDSERLVCPGDYIETVIINKQRYYTLHKKKTFEKYFSINKVDEIKTEGL